MSEIAERLRDLADQRHMDRGHDAVDDALREAADEISSLKALCDEMAKALEPFAEEADCYDPDDGDNDATPWAVPSRFKIRDLRTARSKVAAYRKEKEVGNGVSS